MKKAVAGNTEAFGRLADRWRGPLTRLGYRLARNREDAEDICQETLVKAYGSISRLSDPQKFPLWMHRIAMNVYQDRRRREKARPAVPLEIVRDDGEGVSLLDRLAGATGENDGPAADMEAQELREIMQGALDTLPDEQREAIVLREFQGLSTAEIAEIMGVPTATVRTRIFYGLRKMHDMLERPLGDVR